MCSMYLPLVTREISSSIHSCISTQNAVRCSFHSGCNFLQELVLLTCKCVRDVDVLACSPCGLRRHALEGLPHFLHLLFWYTRPPRTLIIARSTMLFEFAVGCYKQVDPYVTWHETLFACSQQTQIEQAEEYRNPSQIFSAPFWRSW